MFDIENLNSGDIFVNSVNIHYYRSGGGNPPIVLLHGITDSGKCWPRVVQHLGNDFDLVMLDARGHGLSDAPDRGYSFQEQAADVVGVLDLLNINRPVLIGHSMGAMTAIEVSGSSPGLVRALVLEDPPLSANERGSFEATKLWIEESRTKIVEGKGKALAELISDCRDQAPNWSEHEFMPWAEAKHQVSPNVVEIAYSLQLPWRSMFMQINCPILLLTADPHSGARITPEIASEAASLWPDGRVVNIRNAGHNIRRDQFEKYLAALHVFLAEVHQKGEDL